MITKTGRDVQWPKCVASDATRTPGSACSCCHSCFSQPVKSAEMGGKDSRRADFAFARKEEFITPQGLASECSTEGLKASGPGHIPPAAPSQKNQSRIALLLKPPKKADQLDLPPCHTQQGQSWRASGGQEQESHLSLLPAYPFSPLFPRQTQVGIMHPFHSPGKESLAGADTQSLGSKATWHLYPTAPGSVHLTVSHVQ